MRPEGNQLSLLSFPIDQQISTYCLMIDRKKKAAHLQLQLSSHAQTMAITYS